MCASRTVVFYHDEAVSEYRKKFAERSQFASTLLVSLANDFVGYLPTDEIIAQGAYEAGLCPCHPIEEALTQQVDAVLAKAKNQRILTVQSPASLC